MADAFTLRPIGKVVRNDHAVLQIDVPYRPALAHLADFSHVVVLWWVSGHDDPQSREIMQCELPYAPGFEAGVFACRSEYRPNPIGVTVCPILDVDEAEGRVTVADIDAFDGTPLLDLKPYIGVTDRVREIIQPPWFDDWPQWLPDEGLGL
ncbi:MAG: SAM-dependent methyltransferase [Actinobacteria bacterium]|nr:SAM-dependent methyltransferase [Actinomycetota bacterium]